MRQVVDAQFDDYVRDVTTSAVHVFVVSPTCSEARPTSVTLVDEQTKEERKQADEQPVLATIRSKMKWILRSEPRKRPTEQTLYPTTNLTEDTIIGSTIEVALLLAEDQPRPHPYTNETEKKYCCHTSI